MIDSKIRIGVSACLLGENVRFDGGNCNKSYLTKCYTKYFDYKVVCPEIAAGFGVPRNAMFLYEKQNDIIVITHKENNDVTKELQDACDILSNNLGEIYGFILKSKSPSCGVTTAKLFDENNNYTGKKVDGLFVKTLKKYNPILPIEDDGRLNDKGIREHFLRRVFCYYDLKNSFMNAKDITEMMEYHSKHKILLRMHNNKVKKLLGNMLSSASDKSDLNGIKNKYIEIFMQAISKHPKRGSHYMALQNVLREVNKVISKSQRKYLQDILDW